MDYNKRDRGHAGNIVVGIFNFVTLVISIAIMAFGLWIWKTKQAHKECEILFVKQIILLGIFILVGFHRCLSSIVLNSRALFPSRILDNHSSTRSTYTSIEMRLRVVCNLKNFARIFILKFLMISFVNSTLSTSHLFRLEFYLY